MKRTVLLLGSAIVLALAMAKTAPAQPILYEFTGLPGDAGTCKWFDDNLNADRSVGALTHETDLLYNRLTLPVDQDVRIGGSATTNEGDQVVDYGISSRRICSTAEAIYGPTPEPSSTASATPLPHTT
jgi:hypothetical protein